MLLARLEDKRAEGGLVAASCTTVGDFPFDMNTFCTNGCEVSNPSEHSHNIISIGHSGLGCVDLVDSALPVLYLHITQQSVHEFVNK